MDIQQHSSYLIVLPTKTWKRYGYIM